MCSSASATRSSRPSRWARMRASWNSAHELAVRPIFSWHTTQIEQCASGGVETLAAFELCAGLGKPTLSHESAPRIE